MAGYDSHLCDLRKQSAKQSYQWAMERINRRIVAIDETLRGFRENRGGEEIIDAVFRSVFSSGTIAAQSQPDLMKFKYHDVEFHMQPLQIMAKCRGQVQLIKDFGARSRQVRDKYWFSPALPTTPTRPLYRPYFAPDLILILGHLCQAVLLSLMRDKYFVICFFDSSTTLEALSTSVAQLDLDESCEVASILYRLQLDTHGRQLEAKNEGSAELLNKANMEFLQKIVECIHSLTGTRPRVVEMPNGGYSLHSPLVLPA